MKTFSEEMQQYQIYVEGKEIVLLQNEYGQISPNIVKLNYKQIELLIEQLQEAYEIIRGEAEDGKI